MNGVNWTIPPSLIVLDGLGTNCITITPDPVLADGAEVNISAQAIINGNCTAIPSSKGVKVYSSETPPMPEGEFEIIFEFGEETYDPCKDGEEATWEIIFIPDDPYLNGITTVTPGVVIDVPHHHVEDRIIVTVCNVNFCSGEKTCRTWTLFLPSPCLEDDIPDDIFGGKMVYMPNDDSSKLSQSNIEELSKANADFIRTRNENSNIFYTDLELKLFPNPAKDKLTIQSNQDLIGSIQVYNVCAKEILNFSSNGSRKHELLLKNLAEGIYYLIYRNGNKHFLETFVIQK